MSVIDWQARIVDLLLERKHVIAEIEGCAVVLREAQDVYNLASRTWLRSPDARPIGQDERLVRGFLGLRDRCEAVARQVASSMESRWDRLGLERGPWKDSVFGSLYEDHCGDSWLAFGWTERDEDGDVYEPDLWRRKIKEIEGECNELIELNQAVLERWDIERAAELEGELVQERELAEVSE